MEPTVTVNAKDAIIEQIKTEAVAIAKKHSKAMVLELNEVVGPLALDLLAEVIPTQIDNAIIDQAKPLVQSGVAKAVEQVFA